MFSYTSIKQAQSIIRQPADGSKANDQARQQAKSHLLEAATELMRFAELKPGSDPAQYISMLVVELQMIASMA